MASKGDPAKPTPIPLRELISEYKSRSENITKAVRAMALGVIAALWAIFTAEGVTVADTGLFELSSDLLVKVSFVCATATLLTDLLHYCVVLWMTTIGIDRYEDRLSQGKKVEFFYDEENLGRFGYSLYWVGYWLFPAKVIIALFSGFSFVMMAFAVGLNQ